MDQLQKALDYISNDQLTLGILILVCLTIGIIGSNIAYRYSSRKMGIGRPIRRRTIRFDSMKLVIIAAALGFAFLVFKDNEGPSITSSPSTLTGRVTHVRDGDTIEVSNTAIRFTNLDCAELGTSVGELAKTRMRALVRGKKVTCELTGRRSYDRIIGECSLSGQNLSEIMIAEGYCDRWR